MCVRTDMLGKPEPTDWHAHGMSWALAESFTDRTGSPDWTADDIAKAFAAGAACATARVSMTVTAIRQRIIDPAAEACIDMLEQELNRL